jgi:hypothetical protein
LAICWPFPEPAVCPCCISLFLACFWLYRLLFCSFFCSKAPTAREASAKAVLAPFKRLTRSSERAWPLPFICVSSCSRRVISPRARSRFRMLVPRPCWKLSLYCSNCCELAVLGSGNTIRFCTICLTLA